MSIRLNKCLCRYVSNEAVNATNFRAVVEFQIFKRAKLLLWPLKRLLSNIQSLKFHILTGEVLHEQFLKLSLKAIPLCKQQEEKSQ